MAGIQNYFRLYNYVKEYEKMQLDFFAKHALAFPITYWNIDPEKTVWDRDIMQGGAYERIGDLSGIKYNKFLLLPIYFPDEILTSFNGTEVGVVKDQQTTITIPSAYGITPYEGDIIKLNQGYLQEDDTYPFFIVTNREIAPNTDKRFWRLTIKIWQMDKIEYIEKQTEATYVFFEYDKKIYPLDEATRMAKLLSQNEDLKVKLEKTWNPNSGFYS